MIPLSSGHRHSKFSPKNAVRAAVATAIHTTPFLTHAAQSVPTSSALIQWNDGVAPFESTTALEQLETTGTGYPRRSCPSSDWIPTHASSLSSLDPTVVVVDVLTLEDIHSHNHVFSSAYVLGGSGSESGSGSGSGGATVDMSKYLKAMRAYLVDVGDAKFIHHAGGLKAIHLVAPDFSVRHYSVESCTTDENVWNANNPFGSWNKKSSSSRSSARPPPCPFTSSSTTSSARTKWTVDEAVYMLARAYCKAFRTFVGACASEPNVRSLVFPPVGANDASALFERAVFEQVTKEFAPVTIAAIAFGFFALTALERAKLHTLHASGGGLKLGLIEKFDYDVYTKVFGEAGGR